MSRIGKKPVVIPAGVTATLDGKDLKVKGAKGELAMTFVDEVDVELADNELSVQPINKRIKRHRQMWGMQRTIASNLVTGVVEGFTKKLEIKGVGYRAQVKGKQIVLNLGLSHDVTLDIPEGLTINCPTQTEIEISGIDKQLVGQFAAEIREWRKPEPYKGKGIKYAGEYIFRKEGKKK